MRPKSLTLRSAAPNIRPRSALDHGREYEESHRHSFPTFYNALLLTQSLHLTMDCAQWARSEAAVGLDNLEVNLAATLNT